MEVGSAGLGEIGEGGLIPGLAGEVFGGVLVEGFLQFAGAALVLRRDYHP